MRFPYVLRPTTRPVYSLGGAWVRPRPIIPLQVTGPLGFLTFDCWIDPGTDDTIFPRHVATALGVSLTQPPDVGEATPIGGPAIRYRYGQVTLRVTDGLEAYDWEAIVGFIDTPLAWPPLGLAGFLQFFDVQLLGARHDLILTPNTSFPGRVTYRLPSP